MPETPVAPSHRRRRWPWIVAAVLLVAFLLRGPLLAPVVCHVVAGQLASIFDGHAEVGSAGGGWFGDARLDAVVVEAPLGTVQTLRVRSVQATYGLGLLRGDPTALRSLTLDGLSATIDLRHRRSDAPSALAGVLELLPRPLPAVTCTGEVRLLLPDHEVHLSHLRLDAAAERIALAVRVQVGEAEPLMVTAAFLRPSADTVRLESAVVLGDATIETLELVLGHARQQLIASVGVGGGRLRVHGDPANVRVVAEGLALEAVPPALAALLPDGLAPLSGVVAGEATAVQSPHGWQVAGALRVAELRLAGVGPFALDGRWRLADGTVQLTHVEIAGPAQGRATGEGLVWTPSGPRAGIIRTAIPDLRGWVPAWIALPAVRLGLGAEVAVEGEALVIRTARLHGDGIDLTVQGSLASSPWRLEAVDARAQLDLATLATVVPGAPNLAGTLRLRATGTLPLDRDPAALLATPCELQVRGDDLVVGALTLARLRLDAHTADRLLHLTHGELAAAGITARFAGSLARRDALWHGTVTALTLGFPRVEAHADAAFPVVFGAERWSAGPLRLASVAGTLAIEASHHDGAGLLTLDAPRLELGRLGVEELDGTATIALDLRGDWSAPLGHLRLASEDLRIGDRRAQVDLHLTQDRNGIAAGRGRLSAGDDGTARLEGSLPVVLGAGGVVVVPDDGRPARLVMEVPALERWIPGRVDSGALAVTLDLGTAEDPAAVRARLRYDGVRPVRATRGTLRPADAPAALAGEAVLTADAGGLALTFDGSADGRAVLRGELRSPGAWDPVALWQRGHLRPVTGRLELDGADLERFAGAIPGLLHLSGSARGAVEIAGSLQAPHLVGDLALDDIELKVTGMVPTLSDGRARLELRDGRIRLHDAVGDLGGEPLQLAGTFTTGADARLDLTLTGTNVLLVQRHDARLRGDLALTLSGPPSQLTLTGRTTITNALFSPDIGLFGGGGGISGDGRVVPFEFNDPPLSTLRFDVAVSSAHGEGRDGVRLTTDLVRAECDVDLHLRGTGATPELAGRVTVRKGVVYLPFSTLRLSTGELLFPEGDPFHPRLNAVANAQVRRWRIALAVDGPLSDPQVRAGGDGLDERDALLLLTTGSTSAELSGEEGQRAALGRLGTWLGAEAWDLVDGERDPDAGPGLLERVTLQFGREVSEAGKDTIEAEVELTDPDLVPGVLLYGEQDRWDDYNAGLILRFRWGGEE